MEDDCAVTVEVVENIVPARVEKVRVRIVVSWK